MITAENLTKRFDKTQALNEVSFSIDDGCIYGLVGSNGSGKSTLLRLISGVCVPDGGSISVDGQRVFDNPALKSQILFLGDTPYFLPQADLNEMARFYAGLYPSFSREVFNHLLQIFPISAKMRISSMSKGMQRQAALILAMSVSPRYLLLDEAFDGLDAVIRNVLKNLLISGIESRNMTTIIASHNLRELEDMCDHVGLLHSGKILFNDEIDRLKGGLHKVQAAFSDIPELSAFSALNVLKTERTGSLLQMIVRGDEEEILSFIKRFSPLFVECVPPTLEEMFLYELEVTGYDVKNILK